MVAVELQPYAPEARLPDSQRLAALIDRQQDENDQARAQVRQLQAELQRTRDELLSQQAGTANQHTQVASVTSGAGLAPVSGPGFIVTLDDSTLDNSATSNLNNLVIHSRDVQAVVNGLWNAGARAISINGQRLVSTSAVLCVGNTLLLNGSVYAPPYEISAIGASREIFTDDALVKRLRADATKYSLQFTVGRDQTLNLPAYNGGTSMEFARPSA